MSKIINNIHHIRATMQEALRQVGRSDQDVQLIAVSKTRSVSDICEAITAGQRHFGENRVQEAVTKFTILRSEYSNLELHLIGPLQTNKVDEAVTLFDVIQTLDRPKLAQALAKAMLKAQRKPRLYVEINIGYEPQKAGVVPEKLDDFLGYCREDLGLILEGLMCIPPHNVNPKPYFDAMKKLVDQQKMEHLSMGMSADFVEAIMAGATDIRVGSALFGERDVAII